jgi:hypothetical protein
MAQPQHPLVRVQIDERHHFDRLVGKAREQRTCGGGIREPARRVEGFQGHRPKLPAPGARRSADRSK